MDLAVQIRHWGERLAPYADVYEEMKATVESLKHKSQTVQTQAEQIWFLQHTPIYTYGARTPQAHIDMAESTGVPVVLSSRGGHLTFHGPGQRVVYVMMDLRARGLGVVAYVQRLQEWILAALKLCGIAAFLDPDHIGVWTDLGKVASMGVRVSGGVTWHGLAINVAKEMSGFDGIVPCGLVGRPISSLAQILPNITLQDVDAALLRTQPF